MTGVSQILELQDLMRIGMHLSALDPDKNILDMKEALSQIRTNLVKAGVSIKTQRQVYDVLDDIRRRYGDDEYLKIDDREKLRVKKGAWFNLVEDELERTKILQPQKSKTLNQDELFSIATGSGYVFFGEAWSDMSDIQRKDFTEGARCLIAEAWTAAAMISFRSVESILRIYYKTKTRKNAGNKGMWKLIDELTGGKMEGTVLSYFDYLRGIRNKVDHPDEIFDQLDAEEAFANAAAVTREIYTGLRKKRRR